MNEEKKTIKEMFEKILVEKAGEKISEIFDKLEENLKKEGLPNIPTKTMGGKMFWDNIVEKDGWKLQRNSFTRHYRILNPENIRKAWGTEEAMKNIIEKLIV